jgi:hypothetical protein
MSSNGKTRREYTCGRDTPQQPGDQQEGGWPRERLLAMDQKFTRAVERAFESGSERRQSAGGANASRLR